MGNGILGPRKRYMGGKTLYKFFLEDILPVLEHLFDRLRLSESKAFELFQHFARMDTNENGVIDNKELLTYFGIEKNRFTERIFYHELADDNQDLVNLMNQHGPGSLQQAGINVNRLKQIGVTFREFVIYYWNYCTMTCEQLARYVFEIFDIDNNLFLHRNYLYTIYKMLYHTDDDPEPEYYDFYTCTIRYKHEKQGGLHMLQQSVPGQPSIKQQPPSSSKSNSKRSSKKHKRRRLRSASSGRNNEEKEKDSILLPSSHKHATEEEDESEDEDNSDDEDEGIPIEEFTKVTFIEMSTKNPVLIQPILTLQSKLRKRICGKMYWESCMNYRKRQLKGYDEQSDTLQESLQAILQSAEDMKLKKLNNTTEKILEFKTQSIKQEKEMAERELVLFEKQKASEAKTQELYGKDRPMKIAWSIYEQKKKAFERDEFTLDDIWRRRECREELYHLLDDAIDISKQYHIENDDRELKIAEGVDLDHEARYQDYLKSEEGIKIRDFLLVYHVFNKLLKEIKAKNKKNKRYNEAKKSNLQLTVETNMMELVKVYEQLKQNYHLENKLERERAIKAFCRREFQEELKAAKKNAKRSDFTYAEETAHQELLQDLKQKTIHDAQEAITKAKEEREKDYVRKEFDVASNYGSRITRWEKVLNKETNRMLYINVDTLENRHFKTAICEHCDGILVQSELTCDTCNAPRSAFNMKLYRPLGFKDITLE